MRVGFSKGNFEALAELWNGCFPDAYRIDEGLLRQNTVDSPTFDWGASCIEIDDDGNPLGFVAVNQSSAKLYDGADPDRAHICAITCPDCKLGVDLMAYVKRVLRDRGAYKLSFGQGARHFFPGCPIDFYTLRDFLIIEGFEEGAEVYDMKADLRSFEAKPSDSVRPLGKEDVPALEAFLRSEFPGRWHYDTMAKISAEERSDFVYGLFDGSNLVGFCVTQDPSHKLRIGGAVFAQNEGSNWSALGPIGVAKNHRGSGLGDALLTGTMAGLKNRAEFCIVDWTGLKDWYGKHGFEVTKSYRSFDLSLAEVDTISGMTPPL